MAEPKDDALVKSVESVLAEKVAVAAKEKKLIEELNAVLKKMGYHWFGFRRAMIGARGRVWGRSHAVPPAPGKGSRRRRVSRVEAPRRERSAARRVRDAIAVVKMRGRRSGSSRISRNVSRSILFSGP